MIRHDGSTGISMVVTLVSIALIAGIAWFIIQNKSADEMSAQQDDETPAQQAQPAADSTAQPDSGSSAAQSAAADTSPSTQAAADSQVVADSVSPTANGVAATTQAPAEDGILPAEVIEAQNQATPPAFLNDQ